MNAHTSKTDPHHIARFVAGVLAAVTALLVLAACGGSDGDTADGAPADRCERNSAVGTITYVSGFDFAASPGILDPIVAEAEGYFDELCLDVVIQPGFAPSNHALVASGGAQFANAGSFGEVVNTNVSGEAGLVAIAHYGKTAIETLIVPADSDIETLDDLSSRLVGIKGDLPYSLQSMIGLAGVERSSFDELLLDTFDPVAGFDLGIDALPAYKSNEPLQLDAAGFDYRTFDPLDFDVPSSFGILVTSEDFLADHPLVVQDFLRASLRAFAFSVENPEVAVGHALDAIAGGDNPAFLGDYSEIPRWNVERQLVIDTTPDGQGFGVLDEAKLEAEIEALTSVGVFDELPDWQSMIELDLAQDLYDGTAVQWPDE